MTPILIAYHLIQMMRTIILNDSGIFDNKEINDRIPRWMAGLLLKAEIKEIRLSDTIKLTKSIDQSLH